MILYFALLFLSHSVTGREQMRFTDAQHGVSFTYPQGYTLKRGPLAPHDTGLGYLGPIPTEFVAPGGVRIATVEAPPGSYPGTDFVNAFFTVSVNPFLTREECGHFDDRRPNLQKLVLKTAAGVALHGVNVSEAGVGHQASVKYYHVFSRGQCIELGYGLATAGLGAVDGMRQTPYPSIESRFKDIFQSVVISQPRGRRAHGSPEIRHFEFAPSESASGHYGFTWDVRGAQKGALWLSANCMRDITIESQAADGSDREPFACGVLHPLRATRGFINLLFANRTGRCDVRAVRLFVAGTNPASSTVSVPLVPRPRIYSLTSYGQTGTASSFGPGTPIGIGFPVQIHGIAFDADESITIGPARIRAKSDDGRTLSFTVPTWLTDGQYDLRVEDDRGSSNSVRVLAARPNL